MLHIHSLSILIRKAKKGQAGRISVCQEDIARYRNTNDVMENGISGLETTKPVFYIDGAFITAELPDISVQSRTNV